MTAAADRLTHLDAAAVRELADAQMLVDALEDALRADPRPDAGPPRVSMPTSNGEVLLMPAANAHYAGVKVLGLAPDNAASGLPSISGLYLLLDARTLRPVATLDGAELTTHRTAAVSALAVRHLANGPIGSVVIFGSGPQASAHLETLHALHGFDQVVVVGRDHHRATRLAERFAVSGVSTRVGGVDDVRDADLVLCCTNARSPLFGADSLRDDTVVVAVGSHHPDARELGTDVMAAADVVVVEDRPAAEREAGDVVQAVAAGALDPVDLVELTDLVREPHVHRGGTRVFKSVGVAWEDLVVAAALVDREPALGSGHAVQASGISPRGSHATASGCLRR